MKFLNSYTIGSPMSTLFKILLILVAFIPLATIAIALIGLVSKLLAFLLASVFVIAILAGVIGSGFVITSRLKEGGSRLPLSIVWVTLIGLFLLGAPGLFRVSFSVANTLLWVLPPLLVLGGLAAAWWVRKDEPSAQ